MAPATTLVVNDPGHIVLCNEKLWAMAFPDLHPPTLLTRDLRQIRAFAADHDRIVLKPWDGNGGRGIVVTHAADKNLGSLVELLTDEGRRACIAQAYVPAIEAGDKRILLFDGEPVGAILRVPGTADHRGNMHVGARVQATELSARDRAICARLGPELARRGMLFVGIDVIGEWLTEINVTSPTGIQEANRLYGLRLEADLVDRVASRLAGRRT
jgi:glutathione synthase